MPGLRQHRGALVIVGARSDVELPPLVRELDLQPWQVELLEVIATLPPGTRLQLGYRRERLGCTCPWYCYWHPTTEGEDT